ncbi:hypothetical protein ACVOMS_20675 [Bradyrhizobium guangxiense]
MKASAVEPPAQRQTQIGAGLIVAAVAALLHGRLDVSAPALPDDRVPSLRDGN